MPAKLWNNDHELYRLARRELFTAVVGDILDQMGLLHQFLPPRLRPLREDMVLIGRAMPVLEQDIPTEPPDKAVRPGPAKSFGLMLDALDDLKPGEVYLCAGASPSYALWGELMSTRALKLGAAGAVLDGYARDTREILNLGFPTFCLGSFAQDQAPRGKVVDFRLPVEIDGVRVRPGDIVFGDLDGVLVVPRDAEEEAFTRAVEKARGEKTVKQDLQAGLSASEAFAKHGIM